MRVSNRQISRNYLNQLNGAYSNYTQINAQISSGYKYTQASDNVADTTKALKIRTQQNKVEQQLSNISNYSSELNNTEDVMTSIKSILTNINSELAVEAESETTGDDGYTEISEEISELRDELLTLANSQYSGKYVFGGTNSTSAPFSIDEDTGDLLYNGIDVNDVEVDDDGNYYYTTSTTSGGVTTTVTHSIPMNDAEYIDIGNGIKMTGNSVNKGTGMCVTYSGLDIFGYGTDSDGLSNNIFNIISQLSDAIADGDTDAMTTYNDKLTELADAFQINITDVGVKLDALDSAETRLESLSDTYETQISNLIGVSDTDASIEQSSASYTLQAVLSVGSDLLPMSLMDYIS